jgi:multidrug efflux system outer membrane protein
VRLLAPWLVLLTATAALAQDEPAPDTLPGLLEAAEAHWPELRADAHAVDAAEARLGEARWSPFFAGWRLDAGATLAPGSSGTPIFSNQSQLPLDQEWGPVLQVGIRGVVPILAYGKLRGARDAARAGIDAAELQREVTLARITYDVRRAWFGLQLALDVKQMIGEGRGKLVRAIEKLDEMLADGDPEANPIDRRRLAAALAEIDARASQAELLHRSSLAALRTLTGKDAIEPPVCPMAPVALPEAELGRFVEASEERPELGMLAAALEAREANVEVQRGDLVPMVGLGFRAGLSWAPHITDQENPFIQDPANTPVLGAGLFLRWNLDFAGATFRRRRAEAQLAETRDRARAARRGIELEVELAYEQVRDAQRREEAWATGERETRAWFVGAAQAYDIGTLEPRDLIDALKGYFTARYSHLQAVLELNTAIAHLERATGDTLIDPEGWDPACD